MAAKTSSIILLVDDYSDNRTLLSAWLRAKGYRVVEAADGREGVLQANCASPDLILIDRPHPRCRDRFCEYTSTLCSACCASRRWP